MTKLSSKLKKRPSFVDDEKSWNPEFVQILGWVIFSLVLVCLVVMFLITYATFKGPLRSHFRNEETQIQSESHPPPSQELQLQQEFLLDKDVTYEEVIEMQRVMEEDGSVDEEVFVEEDIFYNDLPVPMERLSKQAKQFVDPAEAMLKAKTVEESKQIIEKAEVILDRETQLLQEVSKKLDEFVAYTKTLTNEVDVDTQKDDEGFVSVDSQKIDENEFAIDSKPSKPRGKRTKNKNPLTKSIGPKMTKAKIQKLPLSTTSTSIQPIQPTLLKDDKLDGEPDNSTSNPEHADEQNEEEGEEEEEIEESEDYDYDDEDQAELGEERVKRSRSRSGSRFGRSRVRMMTFRKHSGLDKSRDSNDLMMDDSNGDD